MIFARRYPQNLPPDYILLDKLSFSGGQYIDTGITGNDETCLEISFHNTVSTNSAVFGADGGWTVNGFGLWVNNTIIAPVIGSQSGSVGVTFSNDMDTVLFGPQSVVFNGLPVWNRGSTEQFTTPAGIFIGAVNRDNSPFEFFTGQIGFARIISNGETLRNFIPCQNPSGARGLYDTVSRAFFGNSGTGSIQ